MSSGAYIEAVRVRWWFGWKFERYSAGDYGLRHGWVLMSWHLRKKEAIADMVVFQIGGWPAFIERRSLHWANMVGRR